MYELWIRDGARVERVTTAADKGTLRRMWRVHRDAAITLRGEVLEFKTGCSDKARAPIASAARQAFRDEPSQPAPLPPPEVEEPEEEHEDDDDLEAAEECHADGELVAHPEATEPEPEPEDAPAEETAPTTAPTEPAPAASPEDRGALISDADLERLALAEEAFRAQWAREVGLDPATADLDALPPVAPATAPRTRRAV